MARKRYEILGHPADLKIRAFGKTKEELFLNIMIGMSENMKPEIKKPAEKTKREIKIGAADLAALLVDFLNEVLYLSQINKEVYFETKFKEFSETSLASELIGQKVARFGEDIKAVTYHNLDIHQEEDGSWQATILFDV